MGSGEQQQASKRTKIDLKAANENWVRITKAELKKNKKMLDAMRSTRKEVSLRHELLNWDEISSGGLAPPLSKSIRILPSNWGDHPSPEALKVVLTALESFNEHTRGDQYKFVGGVHINTFVDEGIWYHVNFKGKPIAETSRFNPNLETDVFFAELRRVGKGSNYDVMKCQLLGPEHIVRIPSLQCCKACDVAPHRDVLIHGSKGFQCWCVQWYMVLKFSFISLCLSSRMSMFYTGHLTCSSGSDFHT